MGILNVIIDVVLIVVACAVVQSRYKRDAVAGLVLMGKAFGLVAAIGIAFTVAQVMGDGILGIIDFTPSYSPFDIMGMLTFSVLLVLVIEKTQLFEAKKKDAEKETGTEEQ